MERSINDKTRVILFSSPNNPAGSSLSYDQLKQIADIVKKHPKITVISDEIYEHITFDGEHTTISQFDGISDQLIIVNGVSKGFAMTGWRIGYMVGPKELISACDKLQGQFTSGANSIAQWAAAEAISGDMKPTQNMLNTFRKRRDMMVELLSEIPGVETDTPKGAFYLFPKVSSFYGKEFGGRTINDSLDFCDYILNTALVSLVPGVAFGMDEHVRISYASSEEELREAMKRIKAALT
jgi:aspartate aminotransferase